MPIRDTMATRQPAPPTSHQTGFAARARIAAAAPYTGRDMTFRDIETVMAWLTDLAPTLRFTGMSSRCSTLWLQGQMLLHRLGHADPDEVDRRLSQFTGGVAALRRDVAARLRDEGERTGALNAAA
jgi:hypothetical protein